MLEAGVLIPEHRDRVEENVLTAEVFGGLSNGQIGRIDEVHGLSPFCAFYPIGERLQPL